MPTYSLLPIKGLLKNTFDTAIEPRKTQLTPPLRMCRTRYYRITAKPIRAQPAGTLCLGELGKTQGLLQVNVYFFSYKMQKEPEGSFQCAVSARGRSLAQGLEGLVAATATAVTTTAAATAAATAVAAAIATAVATTTIAAAVAAAIATTVAAATAAGGTGFHGTGFIDDQITATKVLTVHALDSGLGFGIAAHFDKAETFGAASVALHHDLGARNSTVLAKGLFQILIAERVGQVAHVKFVAHEGLPKKHKTRWSPTQSTNL